MSDSQHEGASRSGEDADPRRFSIDLVAGANALLPRDLRLRRGEGGLGDDDDCIPGKICYDDDRGWRTGSGTSGEVVLFAALATAGTVYFLYELFKQAIEINWQNFGRPMPGGDADFITLTETTGTPDGELILTLKIDSSIYWWKAVEVHDGTGRLLGSAWCKRDEGVVENTTRVFEYQQPAYIVFKKAKTLGAHTSMYVVRDVESRLGRRLDFTWVAQD